VAVKEGDVVTFRAFNVIKYLSFMLRVVISVTVIKLIHPSLLSANTVLASDKLGYGDNSGSSD